MGLRVHRNPSPRARSVLSPGAMYRRSFHDLYPASYTAESSGCDLPDGTSLPVRTWRATPAPRVWLEACLPGHVGLGLAAHAYTPLKALKPPSTGTTTPV